MSKTEHFFNSIEHIVTKHFQQNISKYKTYIEVQNISNRKHVSSKTGGTQHPLGPENPLKSVDFYWPGGAQPPQYPPPEYASLYQTHFNVSKTYSNARKNKNAKKSLFHFEGEQKFSLHRAFAFIVLMNMICKIFYCNFVIHKLEKYQ